MKNSNILKSIKNTLKNSFFDDITEEEKFLFSQLEYLYGYRMINDNKVYYMYYYSEELKRLIKSFKFKNNTYLSKYFAIEMYKMLDKFNNINYEYITYVPNHCSKEFLLGFNQSKLIAEHLSSITNKPLVSLFFKNCHTKAQHFLKNDDKNNNLNNTISLNNDYFKYPKELKDSRGLIVDDLVTTGNTFNTCFEVAKKYNLNLDGICIGTSILKEHKDLV